jgi:hypothetical protein
VVECGPEPPAIRLREAFPCEGDGLARESAANNVNWGSSGVGSGTGISGGMIPIASSMACSSPGGLDWPPCFDDVMAFRLFRFRDAIGVGQRKPPFGACSDVVMAGNLRPVLRKDLPAPRIYLDLPGDGHAGAFEAEVEAADTGEQ